MMKTLRLRPAPPPPPPISWKTELRYSLRRALYYGLATLALYALSFVLLGLGLLPSSWPGARAAVACGAVALPLVVLWYLFAAFVSATHLIGKPN